MSFAESMVLIIVFAMVFIMFVATWIGNANTGADISALRYRLEALETLPERTQLAEELMALGVHAVGPPSSCYVLANMDISGGRQTFTPEQARKQIAEIKASRYDSCKKKKGCK